MVANGFEKEFIKRNVANCDQLTRIFNLIFLSLFLTEGSKKGAKTKHSVVVFYTQLSADCGSSEKGKQTSKFKRPCGRKANTVAGS